MNKLFRLLMCMLIAAFTFGIANAATDRDGNRFIYLAGPQTSAMPIAADSAKWASNRMFETSPGSNIYEITKSAKDLTWGQWIRFYSDLADGLPDSDTYKCYQMNQILPAGYSDVTVALTNGSFYYSGLVQTKYAERNNSFILPDYNTEYYIRVDLNNNSLLIIPEDTYLAIVNDEFSFDRITEYPDFKSLASHYPAGDLKFRIYHPFDNKWINPLNSDNAVFSNQKSYQEKIVEASDTAGVPFSASDWKGGVLKGESIGNNYFTGEFICTFSTIPDERDLTFEPMDLPAIYCAGDYNGWVLSPTNREPGDEAIYKITLPAGTQEFKTLIGDNWDNFAIGSNGLKPVVANGVATYGLYIDSGLYIGNHNFAFPLEKDVILTYNLTKGTATIDATVGLDLLSTVPDNIVDRDQLFVQTPWIQVKPSAESSNAELSCLSGLTNNGDGTYSGSMWVPDGQFKLRFISSLNAKGTPNGVIAPPAGKDREISPLKGDAYSSAENLNEDNAGYWTYSPSNTPFGWKENRVKFTVTTGDKPSVKFEVPNTDPADQLSMLYVIGTPNGWNINESSLILYPNEDGGYYGSFDAAEGEVIFRFYSQLGDWESNSYGFIWDDYVDNYWYPDSETVHIANCSSGKGSYCIPYWPGGKIYVFVNLSANYMMASSEPLEGIGAIIDPSDNKKVYIYGQGYNNYEELTKKSDLYVTTYRNGSKTDGINVRLFTKKLPISTEEPEWEGSYALSSLAKSPVDFDEYNVAEFDFEIKDYVNTEGANPFVTTNNKDNYDYKIAVDLENKKLYVERITQSIVMFGDVTNGKLPTYATRAQFKDYLLQRTGSTVNIPADKAKFVLVSSLADVNQDLLQQEPVEVDLSSGYYDGNSDINGITEMYRNKLMSIPDWKGGKLIVNYDCIVDPTKIPFVTAWVASNDSTLNGNVKLTPASAGSLIFKGKQKFNGKTTFRLAAYEDNKKPLMIGSTAINYGIGYTSPLNEGSDELIPINGTGTAPVAYNSWQDFKLNSLTGSGELEFVLDFNNNTVTVNVPEENSGNVYEVVSQDNASLDGTYGYESDKKEDCIVINATTGSVDSEEEQTAEFNLTTPDGTVISPASGSDTDIVFDKTGAWTGKYASSAVTNRSRASMRRAAANSSKWKFNVPAGQTSTIRMMIDEANSKITIFSSANSEVLYVASHSDYMNGNTGIEHIESMKANTLIKVADEVYQGDYIIPDFKAGEKAEVMISRDINVFENGLCPVIALDRVFELSPEVTESEILAIDNNYYSEVFEIYSQSKIVNITYDNNNKTLRMLYDPSGIEESKADAEKLTVAAVKGGIRFETAKEATIVIYTLTGNIVANRTIEPGTMTIALPAGFYIANGRKLIVR